MRARAPSSTRRRVSYPVSDSMSCIRRAKAHGSETRSDKAGNGRPCFPFRHVRRTIPEGWRAARRSKLDPHDTNAEALAVAADRRGRSVDDPVRLRPECLYRFRPYAVLPARDGFRTRLRLARRLPSDARPGAAASGFPAGYIRVRGRTLSTLGGRRHHRRSVREACEARTVHSGHSPAYRWSDQEFRLGFGTSGRDRRPRPPNLRPVH